MKEINEDRSNGYEEWAEEFIARRSRSRTGERDAREWARALPRGGDVLDLGCGSGIPISAALVGEGLRFFAVDASPTLLAAFHARFPEVPTEWSAVEDSSFFDRTFDGVIAWGLIFLLRPESQIILIEKSAAALRSGGKLLFTSPSQICQWIDVLTRRVSISLGAPEYVRIAETAGLVLEREWEDEGENHYYLFAKLTD